MHSKSFMILMVSLMLLAPQASAQRVEERSYESGSEMVTYVGDRSILSVTSTDGTFDVGGVIFETLEGETRVTVVADDASGTAPRLVACQDLDGDRICGEDGEPIAGGCGSLELAIAPTGEDLLVSVGTQTAASFGIVSVSLLPCWLDVGVGTTGTITATFE